MKGELFINDKDAYIEWGVSMDSSALSALMAPPPMKELPENKSRANNGKEVLYNSSIVKVDERSLTLTLNLTAKNESEFFARYNAFCNELYGGVVNIRTKYQPDVVYRTIYKSCSQFSQFMRGLAHIALKLDEPNPTDRNM